jgi:hypothetical protein
MLRLAIPKDKTENCPINRVREGFASHRSPPFLNASFESSKQFHPDYARVMAPALSSHAIYDAPPPGIHPLFNSATALVIAGRDIPVNSDNRLIPPRP